MIPIGTLVPFVPGMDTNLACFLGTTRNGEQAVLLLEYYQLTQSGGTELVRRIFQRDYREIESFTRDANSNRGDHV